MRPLALACLFLLASSTSIAEADGTATLSGWRSDESGSQSQSTRQEPEFPPLAWPVENPLHDGLMITHYCDNDPAIPALLDYMCGDWTYDIIDGGNHEGTDLTLPSFRAMDRGMPILAAASGLVYMTEWQQFDRHIVAVEGLGNQLIVMQTDASGDTTGQFYNHLRRNSLTVEVGEVVVPGQMLGYIGSSGYSPYPHLHFSVGWSENGEIRYRDPFAGPCNTGPGGEPLPSLWIDQEPYVGNMPLRVYDLGVTTTSAIGAEPSWKERRTQPSIMGADEEYIVAWMLYQGKSGDSWRIEIRRPDDSLFIDWEQAISGNAIYSYAQRLTPFAGSVLPEDYGIWTVSALVASQVVMQVPFEVGETTVYDPRFFPVSGRSIRMDTPIVQRDTLRMSPLCEPVTFSFVDAPDFVAFEQDTIVTFTPPSSHRRSDQAACSVHRHSARRAQRGPWPHSQFPESVSGAHGDWLFRASTGACDASNLRLAGQIGGDPARQSCWRGRIKARGDLGWSRLIWAPSRHRLVFLSTEGRTLSSHRQTRLRQIGSGRR
jgi:murein DD-endopeptidase MepM/ murein hydrolase activator NlpD